MAKNASFDRARKAKQDEFYTQLTDIEREMRYFKQHFNGKQYSVTVMTLLKAISLSILS